MKDWFAAQGWTVWPFQASAWHAYREGHCGLIQVPTGAGKTYAAFMGPLIELIDAAPVAGLHTLYITPLRAVTRDIEKALKRPIADLALPFKVESRTGDTAAHIRARQRDRLPHILITTPESLALLQTRENARELLAGLSCVIVDEWHDLMVSKRGTALELSLARLRAWNPALRTWGMSATIPNAEHALEVLAGKSTPHTRVVIRADVDRPVTIRSVIPADIDRLPWAGHMGLTMLHDVLDLLDPQVPTLVFTNTRSQSERWFHAISYARPDWAPVMALHHGSIDRADRERIEAGLKNGSLKIVVATSSLDLGVDFSPLQRVVQIGSPKGIARTVQRAGRANHRAGGQSIVDCVPTHAMELLEAAAARDAFNAGEIEPRTPMDRPLDVLAQHLVTCGLGGGFNADDMFAEVRTAYSYRDLPRSEFDWAVRMVTDAGILQHYPQFRRLIQDEHGVFRGASARAAQLHRLNVGTITGAETLEIRLTSGKRLGNIDEGFVAQLREGEKFVFAGRVLKFVGIHDLTVLCRPAPGKTTNTPIWAGTRLPITESLSAGLRRTLGRAGEVEAILSRGQTVDAAPELIASRRLIATQRRLSRVPGPNELLVEVTQSREGHHCFLFPFEGRLVHAGLASLLALRLSRAQSGTFSIAANEYGMELLSSEPYPFTQLLSTPAALKNLLTQDGLAADVASSVNMTQLARLAFRDIARVAGLVMPNHPGARKTARQLQASSGLIFDVLTEFDPPPGNLFLEQARREVLDRHFEHSRLTRTMARLTESKLLLVQTQRFTPLSYPLVIEREATKLSSQTISERLAIMQAQWAKETNARKPPT